MPPLSESNDCDVIIGAMASHITSLTNVYSIVYAGVDKKTPKLWFNGLCEGNSPVTDELPAQRASNAEMFSFHDVIMLYYYADVTLLQAF